MASTDFERDLNDEQLAAVTAPDGPLLVLAAAGTGKTRTLVYRMAFLVARGTPPDRILLLTFTNRAAQEMLRRAEEVVHTGVAGLWGGTFHHVCNRMLRRHAALLGFEGGFTILDRDDAVTLIGQCTKDLKLTAREFPRKEVLLSMISTAANTGGALDDVVERRFVGTPVAAADVRRVAGEYARRKLALRAMDFDDLLVNGLRLLSEHARVAEQYREKFRHVLVDEYQDTNPLQARIVDLLAAHHRNLFVVGDDFQSIYGWRGADFRNILTFPDRYADARIFKLETNYRSVPEVLAVANVCIAGNPEQFPKTLRATRDPYRKPLVQRLTDGDDQALFVVEHIARLVRDGYRHGDIGVLYRAHFHAMELQIALTRERIPHVITSGLRFFEQRHIKDVCCVLRAAVQPGDMLAFGRMLELLPGVGPRTVEKLWDRLGGRFDACSAAQRAEVRGALRGEARAEWQRLEPVLSDFLGERTGRDGGEVMARYVKAFYERHARNVFDDADRRLEEIEELIVHTSRCATIESFLSDVALLTNIDAEMDMEDRDPLAAVHLSTVHQAKGLEWPAVIVLWATEGMFPSPRSVRESEWGEAEERRLFYVAVTRAKDELCLCVPERRRTRDGGLLFHAPSRYVAELPPDLVRHERRASCW